MSLTSRSESGPWSGRQYRIQAPGTAVLTASMCRSELSSTFIAFGRGWLASFDLLSIERRGWYIICSLVFFAIFPPPPNGNASSTSAYGEKSGTDRMSHNGRRPFHHPSCAVWQLLAQSSCGSPVTVPQTPQPEQSSFAGGIRGARYHWSNAESKEANCPRQQKPENRWTVPIPNIIVTVPPRQK